MPETAGTTAYALGLRDRSGRLEFLRRRVWPGNLMRTIDPHSAWTWSTVREVELWLEALPAASRDQLADRTLLVIPLRLVQDEPRQSVTLKAIPPPPGSEDDQPTWRARQGDLDLAGEHGSQPRGPAGVPGP